jgi:hypothetical protein
MWGKAAVAQLGHWVQIWPEPQSASFEQGKQPPLRAVQTGFQSLSVWQRHGTPVLVSPHCTSVFPKQNPMAAWQMLPTQTPAEHVSHASQTVPQEPQLLGSVWRLICGTGGEQTPVPGSQVPGRWQRSGEVQVTPAHRSTGAVVVVVVVGGGNVVVDVGAEVVVGATVVVGVAVVVGWAVVVVVVGACVVVVGAAVVGVAVVVVGAAVVVVATVPGAVHSCGGRQRELPLG